VSRVYSVGGALVVGLLGFVVWWSIDGDTESTTTVVSPPRGEEAEWFEPAPTSAPGVFVVVGEVSLVGLVGEGLNAHDGSAQRDLTILQNVLSAWRSNATGQGNPVGTNREITAALTGANHWGFAIIPPDHPAINDAGELCDRWGTPLFFHQLSGDRMEIISYGPDRERGTADDVIVTP